MLDKIINFGQGIVNFVYGNLFWFQFLGISISLIFLWFIIYVNVKMGLTEEKLVHWFDVLESESINQRRSLKAWRQIKKRLEVGGGNNLKLAVLESDRVLGEIFKMSGFPGNNLDERLANLDASEIPNIEELKQAHKLRNRIVSEPDFVLTQGETEIAVGIYKRAFVDLGLIEEED